MNVKYYKPIDTSMFITPEDFAIFMKEIKDALNSKIDILTCDTCIQEKTDVKFKGGRK